MFSITKTASTTYKRFSLLLTKNQLATTRRAILVLTAISLLFIAATRTCSKYLLTRQSQLTVTRRLRSSAPINTIIMFIPQQEAWIVERMGKFHRILEPGLNILFPILDSVKYVQSLKEMAIDIPKQSAITSDNVTLNIDGVLYLRVLDPYLASYGVEDPEFAITQLAQTTMRSEIGKISLDNVFRERESLNVGIVASINKASEAWGITCLRYEIRDIKLPVRVQEAMQMQVEAERKKRAAILESEGVREADINVAEGQRTSRILASEADRQEQINKAMGEAQAMLALAEARAKGLTIVAKSLETQEGHNAASLRIAEQYIDAFKNLAKINNTVILPSDVSSVSAFVSQALAIYNAVSNTQKTAIKDVDKLEPAPILRGDRELPMKSQLNLEEKPPIVKPTDAM